MRSMVAAAPAIPMTSRRSLSDPAPSLFASNASRSIMWSVLHGQDTSPYMSCLKVTNLQHQSGQCIWRHEVVHM
jgi:hypothetical protein